MNTKPVYKCPYCGMRAAQRVTIAKHIETVHPDKILDPEYEPVQE